MIRFISHLFKLNYETCKGCEILKQQLEIANAEKKDLTDTLLGLIKPKVHEAPSREIAPTGPVLNTWGRRRAHLEEQARVAAEATRNSPFIAKPNVGSGGIHSGMNKQVTTEELEKELGLEEENPNEQSSSNG